MGIDGGKLDELRARVRREVDAGLLPSCQFALARHGRLAAFETFGAAANDNRYAIFSATKAFVAAAAWILIGEGRLDVTRRVAEIAAVSPASESSNAKTPSRADCSASSTEGSPQVLFERVKARSPSKISRRRNGLSVLSAVSSRLPAMPSGNPADREAMVGSPARCVTMRAVSPSLCFLSRLPDITSRSRGSRSA